MAEALPVPTSSLGRNSSVQDLLLEQSDVLMKVQNVLDRSYLRLESIHDVVTQSLGIQKQQLSLFQQQLENQEFANEEARREAARMRASSGVTTSGATATVDRGGSALSNLGPAAAAALGGVAGGLAAGGLAGALRGLAGRMLRGGGLIGIGTIFGEQIGNFLGNEAAAILEDLGADPQFAQQVGNALRNNTQSALVGAGISKLLLGRTLPGIIGGIIWNQLDLNRILTPEGRDDLENSIRGWFERLRDGELTDEDIRNGAIVGATAAYGARQLQRGGQALGRRFPTFRPDGTVEGPGQAARPGARPASRPGLLRRFPSFRPDGTVEGPGQAARPGPRPAPGAFVRPRRPNGQFMSDAEIQDMYEQQIRDAKSKRAFRNVVKGLAFLGVALTAYEAYQLYQILNSSASEETKIAAVGGFVGGFVGSIGGGVAGASLGSFFGPWGALIGGALGAGGGAFAGGYIGDYIARWAFDHEPPVYQTQEQYEQFIEQNRARFEAGPNAMIIPGVTADPSGAIQRSAPSYGAQFGSTPGAQPNPEAQRLNREGIDLLEDVVSELEKLNENIESGGTVTAAGFTTTQDGARIYNAALGTSMSAGGRPIQAAFTPGIGQPQLIRASLGETPRVSSQGSTAGMTEDQRKAYMLYSAFIDAGFSDSQAKALVGEVYRENSFQERYWYGTHTDPANQATNAGIISWQGPRKTALYNFLGDRGLLNSDGSMKSGYETLVAQAQFLREEMRTGSAGGSAAQISRYQDWYRSDQVSEEESIRVLGGDFIRWRLNDPRYRSSGLANIEYGRSQIEGLELPSAPDTRMADAPQAQPPAATPTPRQPPAGGDLEAGQSMMGSFAEAIQSAVGQGFGFDSLFGEGTYASILTSPNPEQFIADKLGNVFSNLKSVSASAINLNRGSEAAGQRPLVINAPVTNDNSSIVAAGGGGGGVRSQDRAVAPIVEASAASTLREWWDATVA